MKKFLLTTTMILGFTTAAFAADPVKGDRTDFYAGVSMGAPTTNTTRMIVGLDAGVQLGKYFRVEADVDRYWQPAGKDGYTAILNGIAQYRIPDSIVTPYLLAGAGYMFDGPAAINNSTARKEVWDFGGGVHMGLSQSVELDLRYREVRLFSEPKVDQKQDHVFSAGLNYRF